MQKSPFHANTNFVFHSPYMMYCMKEYSHLSAGMHAQTSMMGFQSIFFALPCRRRFGKTLLEPRIRSGASSYLINIIRDSFISAVPKNPIFILLYNIHTCKKWHSIILYKSIIHTYIYISIYMHYIWNGVSLYMGKVISI